MALTKINIDKQEDEYASQRRWKALIFVLLFHSIAFFSLYKFGFDRTYPPPPMEGIEIEIEFEQFRPRGATPRRNTQQRPVPDPPIVNTSGNTAPESAPIAARNESTKPAPQPEAKPSEISEQGDVPVEAPKPKIDNRALFQNKTQGEEEADNSNSIDDKSLFTGVGREEEATRTANTPVGPDHRQTVTHNLNGRSVVGGFPLPAYNSQNQGTVVVEVAVNQDGKVTKAAAVGKGSTVQDAKLWKAAEEAAYKAKFNVKKDAPISQVGTITYVFRLQ